MLVEVAKVGEIAPGGMKCVRAGERELVVCIAMATITLSTGVVAI
jgi:hypothetical protein